MNRVEATLSASRYCLMLTEHLGISGTHTESLIRMIQANNLPGMNDFLDGILRFRTFSDQARLDHLETLGFEFWMARDCAANKMWIIQSLLEFVPDFNGQKVLDVGSGKGDTLCHLSREFKLREAIGLEPSSRHRSYAEDLKSRLGVKDVQFVEGIAQAIPFEDDHFDVVYSLMSLHWADDKKKWLSEMARVLRPDGYFFIDFNIASEFGPYPAERAISDISACGIDIKDVYYPTENRRDCHTSILGRKGKPSGILIPKLTVTVSL